MVDCPELLQAKKEIQRLNEQLEQRVTEQTSELAATNEALRREIEARQQTEDRLRLIIDTIPAMVFTALPDGSVDYVNQQMLHYMGLSLEDMQGWNWDMPIHPEYGATVHPEDRARSVDNWRSTMAVGQSVENELRVRRADGVYRWILGRFAPLRDEMGNIVKWYGVSTDIDERKRAEALLHAREQEFRAIVENAPDHIIRYDRDFRRAYANPAVARTYGLPAEAVLDKPIGSVIQDAELEVKEGELAQIRQRIADVFVTGTSYEYEMNWPVPAGRRYFSVRLFPERDLNGSIINVLSIARDVTARKHVENELRRQKTILQKIFDHVPVMIALVGKNGRIELVNRTWEHSLGWTLHELEEQQLDIYALAYPDPQYRQGVLDFIAAATGEWRDRIVRVRDGRVIDITVAIVDLSDGTCLVIAQDITERKRVEAERANLLEQVQTSHRQLQTLSRQLLQVQEAERRAIARELHDEIGQQLTSIGLLLTISQQLPPDLAKAQLNKAQTYVEELIGQVRTLALDLRPAILDDFGLVSALLWLFERYTTQTNVSVQFEHRLAADQRFDPDVETSAYRIAQEALTNVARHAGVMKVIVRLWIDGDRLSVMIADQGRGFDPQTVDTRSSSGLTGMQERIALLGGDLRIESAADQGTRVTAIVPIGTIGNHPHRSSTK
jgi:PAS domain S-box-containing protein